MTLPLTKTLDPADYADLAEELTRVDRYFHDDAPQAEQRRWEYALALRAESTWRQQSGRDVYIGYDVGGAGSPFRHMGSVGLVVDPKAPPPGDYALEQFCTAGTELASVVFCLSVLEHVDDLDRFLYHLACLVAPGGLLFLTMDCWNQSGPDTAHFHWMRQRIFTPASITHDVYFPLARRDFGYLGDHEHGYHGDQLYGSYSFASLALIKRT